MIVHSAKEVITKYRKKTDLLTENLADEIKKLWLSAEGKSEAVRGFKDSVKAQRAVRDAMWQCEEGIVSQMENIVRLLSRRRSGWIIQNGEIQFFNEPDSNEFNSYLTMSEQLTLKEQAIQKQAREAMKAVLE